MQYTNFDLSIDPLTEAGYPIRCASERRGEARSLLPTADLERPELQDALDRIEFRETDRELLKTLGADLYRLILREAVEKVFLEACGDCGDGGERGIRVRLRIEPPELAVYPWELIYCPHQDCFLGTSVRTPLVRYLELHGRIQSLEAIRPLRILMVIPDYADAGLQLDAGTEKDELEAVFSGYEGRVEVTLLEGPVTVTRISDALMDRAHQAFHFIGHGDWADGEGVLLLNDELDPARIDPVDGPRLAALFRNHPHLKLVVLNACKGAAVSPTRPFVGLAPQLVRLGIPAVVAMQHGIYDDAAVRFSREFYRHLFRGDHAGRVDMAMAHARNRLAESFPDDREVATPVLFMRAREGVLFRPVSGSLLRDIPLSQASLDTAEAGVRASDGPDLTPPEAAAARRLRNRITLRRYARLTVPAVTVVMFLLFWISAFDLLNLETLAETGIISVGDRWAEKSFSDAIQVVTIDDPDFGPEWRGREHPRLIERLAGLGVRVIVFDMVFETATGHDGRLAAAIRRARAAGTKVILGVRDWDKARPDIIGPLMACADGFGMTCIGRRLGRARTVPLALIPDDGPPVYSLALMAYAAYFGLRPLDNGVDEARRRLILVDETTFETRAVGFTALTRVSGIQKGCPIIRRGDRVAERYLDITPTGTLRDPARRWRYADLMGPDLPDTAKHPGGAIVLVGLADRRDQFWESMGFWGEPRYGVEFHADAINTLMKDVVIRPIPPAGQLAIMAVMGALGCGLCIARPGISRRTRWAVLLLLGAAYLGLAIYVHARHRLLLNSVYHLGALVLACWVSERIERSVFS